MKDFVRQQEAYLKEDPVLSKFYKVCKICGELIKKTIKSSVCKTH